MAFYSIFEVGNGGREQPRPPFTLKGAHPFPKAKSRSPSLSVAKLVCLRPGAETNQRRAGQATRTTFS